MKKRLSINGKSQYAEDIYEKFRPSACGPVTARVILDQFAPEVCPYDVNRLYTMLGSTKIGLTKRRLIGNLRNILGAGWTVADCTVEEAKRQIDQGYAVAAKFDKWFTFRWRGRYAFDYHWVPVIGYEETENDVMLIIHDNGGRNRPSQVRQVSYKHNKSVLSFVKIEPKNLSTN